MFHYSKPACRQKQAHIRGSVRYIFLLLSLLLVLTPFGCGTPSGDLPKDSVNGGTGDTGGKGQETVSRSGNPVNAPVEFFYTVQNPIETVSEEITEGSDEEKGIEVKHNLISIYGLLDKEVEKKINDRIVEAYEKLKSRELPPFRGIKAAIPEDAMLISDSILSDVMANYNNVLSISMSRWTSYSVPDDEGNHIRNAEWGTYNNQQFVSVQEGLSFDLNTGEEIALADVFADNVDYLSQLNDIVAERLDINRAQDEDYWGHWYGIKLAAPFKGLRPDQKFYLADRGIYLIFDYNMPEFYLRDFSSWTMDLNYRDMNKTAAITERFYDEGKNIYTSRTHPKMSLLDSNHSSAVPLKKQEYEDGKIRVYNYTRSSPQFPEKLKDILLEESKPLQKEIDELNRMIKEESLYGDEEVSGYYEQQISGNLIGRYATLTKHTNGGAGSHWFFQLKYRTWDADSAEELTLEDMFREGFDYQPLLRKTFQKAIEDNGGLYIGGRELSPEEGEQHLDRVLSGELSFSPGVDYLWIAAGDMEFSGQRRESLHTSLSFEEIGYENLTIFDEK